jgi:hypothetical protein
MLEELDGPTVIALGVSSWNLSNVHKGQLSDGWPKFIILSSSLLWKARQSRLNLQSLASYSLKKGWRQAGGRSEK